MPKSSARRAEPLASYVPCAWFVVKETFRKYRPRPVSEEVGPDFLYLSSSGCETALGKGNEGDEVYRAGRAYDLMHDGEGRGVGTIFRGYQRSIRFTTGELNVLCDKGIIQLRLK